MRISEIVSIRLDVVCNITLNVQYRPHRKLIFEQRLEVGELASGYFGEIHRIGNRILNILSLLLS